MASQPEAEMDGDPPAHGQSSGASRVVLLLSIFLIATCGLAYELIAGTLSSYLLGNSVLCFSLTIGLFLCAMGVGSFLSQYLHENLLGWFVLTEVLVAVVGGTSAIIGFAAFTFTNLYVPVLAVICGLVGAMIGLEIPLVIRILKGYTSWRVSLAHVLSADYAGALAASVVFPLVLAPHLGLPRAAAVMGLANLAVAWAALLWFRRDIRRWGDLIGLTIGATLLVLTCFATGAGLTDFFEDNLYQDEIILARTTPYQRVVLTRWAAGDDLRLYLNGAIQFSSLDEHRYHEALIHPAMSAAAARRRVLILGGGDGLAARQVLKYDDVERVDLVDLDAVVVELFANRELLAEANEGSLRNPRMHRHTLDAMEFLEETSDVFDVIVMDLPDPNEPATGKLYTRSFYRLAGRCLSPGGALVTQATSPFFSREAFWCIVHTIRAELPDRNVRPYWVYVPSFGEWGFVLADRSPVERLRLDPSVSLRFLNQDLLPGLFVFPSDTAEVPTPINTLAAQALTGLYREGYAKHFD